MKITYEVHATGFLDYDIEEFEDCESAAEVRVRIVEDCARHMMDQNMPGVSIRGLEGLAVKFFKDSRSQTNDE